MRNLRKITFINSAHIRYDEIKLDGNVHFVGTQGVGKSTILRAILFFFNADKSKLGMPKEGKSFDEFYFPYNNSYIIYEVEHEHGPFSVLAWKSNSRVAFRFIDAAFQKEWLVDEYGEVATDPKIIRERAKGVYVSKIVDKYTMYLDIIYGNKQAIEKEFYRFQLMESSRYQNIPRSIQNVLLNSRLEAEFIKDIIISSMGDEEHSMDLGYYRKAVADFEQEYRDIACWYKTDRKGKHTVMGQAESIVSTYHELNNQKKQIIHLSGELKYAIRSAEERQPLVKEELDKQQAESSRQQRLFKEEDGKFENEKDNLNQAIGSAKGKLKEAKEKASYYRSQNIEQVLSRYDREYYLRQQLEGFKEQQTALKSSYNDITSKYKSLYLRLDNQLVFISNQHEKLIVSHSQEKNRQKEILMNHFSKRKKDIEDTYAKQETVAQNMVDEWVGKKVANEKEQVKLKYFHPYEKDINDKSEEIKNLDLKAKELAGQYTTYIAEMRNIQIEFDKKEAELKIEYNNLCQPLEKEIDDLKKRISEIDHLLEHIKGSLFEWLEENKKDWENNIGKVIHEESILYQTGLNPELTEGNSLYGVRLELSELPLTVRKPKELMEEKGKLENQILEKKNESKVLKEKLNDDVRKLKEKYTSLYLEKKDLSIATDTELQSIPNKKKTLLVQIDKYKSDADEILKRKKEELRMNMEKIILEFNSAKDKILQLRTVKSKKINEEERSYRKLVNELDVTYNSQVEKINAERKVQEGNVEIERRKLQKQELDELKGKGADITLINEYDEKIQSVNDELKYIDSKRELINSYLYDKRNLFDKEEEIKIEKDKYQEKISQLTEKYNQKKQKHLEELKIINKKIETYKQEIEDIERNLSKARKFLQDEGLRPKEYDTISENESSRTPEQAVDELTSCILSCQKLMSQLRQGTNVFRSNFSSKNTFNFPTELLHDDNYVHFAKNLNEFLVFNKIEEYRNRTSKHYLDILAYVSKELGELTRNESEVDKVIRDINNDFKERNFAGVIKLIALRPVPSTDKMVLLIKSIKEFHDENYLSIGESSLFATSSQNDINSRAVDLLIDFMKALAENSQRQSLTLSDMFQLQFRIIENDNDTGWVEKLKNVGSDGTDILVKSMINIMIINVFKEKVSKRFGDFKLHCMLDEIGKLHHQNVKGLLDFANARNILLINSSPTTFNVSDYRYTYLLKKNEKYQTKICPLIAKK